jgi:hypothetical protein
VADRRRGQRPVPEDGEVEPAFFKHFKKRKRS